MKIAKKIIFIIYVINLLNYASAEENSEIIFSADKLNYDYKKHILKAMGEVELTRGQQKISSDEVIYNYKLNNIQASGNIKIEAGDDNIFVDRLSLDIDKNIGHATPFKIKFGDKSLLNAERSEIKDKNYTITNAVYTACPICGNKKPLWQIRAKKVNLDNIKNKVTYKDAYFEIYGMSLLYIPYMSHPTRDSPAQTGLLTPRFRQFSELGKSIEQPVYFRISDNKELTLSPVFNTKYKLFLIFDYNHLLYSGMHNMKFSFLKDKNHIRGHIKTQGSSKLNNNWIFFHDIYKSSDQSYLKTYKFSEKDHLNSNIGFNYKNYRNFSDIRLVSIKSLNEYYDKNSNPKIFPYISSHYEYRVSNSSYLSIDNNITILNKKDYDIKRVINNIEYKSSLNTKGGHLIDLINSIRLDAYDYNNKIISKMKFRIAPSTQVNWSYPLYKQSPYGQIYFKPLANLILTQNNLDTKTIPIEDSLYVELSDENLFKSNKWPGYDRVEKNLRINYAIDIIVKDSLGELNLFFGQSYRSNKKYYDYNENFMKDSGLFNRFSDYVGMIKYIPSEYLNVFYKYRIDKKDGSIQKNDLGFNAIYKDIRILSQYMAFKDSYQRQLNLINKQLYLRLETDVTPSWTISGFVRKNLSKQNKKTILAGGNIIYNGDCVNLNFSLVKDYTRNKEKRKNSLSPFFEISLKNLTN